MVEPLNTKDWVLVPQAALDWLFGSGPDADGHWFGDAPDDAPKGRAFWWRDKFRRLLSASPALPAVDGREVVAWLSQDSEGQVKAFTSEKGAKFWANMGGDAAITAEALVRQTAFLAAESRVQSLEEEVKRLRDKYEPEVKTFEFKGQRYTASEVIEKGFYGQDVRTIKVARAALKENGQ